MKKRMRAAIYEGGGKVAVRKINVPEISKSHEVKIKVSQCGICGSDVRALTIPPQYEYAKNIVIGHEFVGVVEQTGKDANFLEKGDRVVVHGGIGCGHCYFCRTGNVLLCPDVVVMGNTINGGMTEYCVVPKEQVFRIPDTIGDEDAIFVEPLACVLTGITKAIPCPGDDVVILGAGPMGLLHMLVLQAIGARNSIVSEISENRRKVARNLGADICVDPESESLTEIVQEVTGGLGADLVVDAVGILLPQAIELVRCGGKIISFGINQQRKVVLNQAKTVMKAINLIGVYTSKPTFPLAIKFLQKKNFSVRELLTHKLPLEEIRKGVDLMKNGEAIKVSIVM